MVAAPVSCEEVMDVSGSNIDCESDSDLDGAESELEFDSYTTASNIDTGSDIVTEELPADSGSSSSLDSSSSGSSSAIDPVVQSGDFGRVIKLKSERRLLDAEKYYLLKHHFVPTKTFNFPVHTFGDHNRRFQRGWLDDFNGLTYSISDDGGYCKFCVLFAQCEPLSQELSVLVQRPLKNLKKAKEKLKEHFGSKGRQSHQIAIEKAQAFCAIQENRAIPIDQQLISRRARLVAENRLKLRSITATVIFCGQQGLAFRGHRDDGPVELDSSANRGNFQALLKFRVDAGDKVLKEHLETASRNATYTSKEIQNQMIVICGDIIRSKILMKVKEAKFYSVIADEASDSANDEQLSISIRYLDSGNPREKFLGFVECLSGVTGEAIANYITSQLTDWAIRSQLIEGASL